MMRKSYIHRDAEAKHSVIVFFSRVVRNDHAVGYNKSWVFWPAWKQTHWMSGIHDERLLIRHCHQVMKREPKLEKNIQCVFTIFFQNDFLGVRLKPTQKSSKYGN